MQKKRFALFLCCFFSGCNLFSCIDYQSMSGFRPVNRSLDFDSAFSVETHYDAKKHRLTIHLYLKPGYHVYGLGEPVGRPLDVVILPKGGWAKKEAARIPTGIKKRLGDQISVVLNNEITISLTLKKGSGPIHGALKLHMCADGSCDRPRDHPFIIQSP